MTDVHANRRGILLMVAGTAIFAANDAASKMASVHMPASEFMAARGLMAAALLFAILGVRRELKALRHVADRMVLLRSGTEAVSAFLYITALGHIGLASASSIMQVVPLVTLAAAALLMGTRIGGRRWAAVMVGFAGVLLVMRPGGETFQMAALLPLACAFLISFRDFMTGRIGPHVPTLVVATVTALFGMLAGLVGSGFESWRAIGIESLGLVAFGAVTLIIGHMLLISAFRGTDPSVVSPFRYANVPFSVAYGALLFGMWPDAIALAGMALIIAAGIYTVRTQNRAAARAATLEPAE